jgi:hypothetical protein
MSMSGCSTAVAIAFLVVAVTCIVACAAPAPAPPVVETHAPVAAVAPPAASSAELPHAPPVSPPPTAPSADLVPAASATTPGTCDDDTREPFDCSTLLLGQCRAAEVYACPRKVALPEGVGFRPTAAARIAACLARPGFDGSDITRCIHTTEACVREAVGASCIDDDALATCKRELGTCTPELQTLCARFLSSLEPKTRVSALDDMRQQRAMTRSPKTCGFNWDINGFPFCPFCPFRP